MRPREILIYGDVPRIPSELRRATYGKPGGKATEPVTRRVTNAVLDRTHDQKAFTR